jgi:hypothetical protein
MKSENKMKRVYVAGKLNGEASDYIKNLHKMIKSGDNVRKAGFSVFIPGIDFLCGLTLGDWDYEHYFQNSQPWLEASDAVFVQGRNWKTSKGTNREIASAKRLGIPVFHNLRKMKSYFSKLEKDSNTYPLTQIKNKCDSTLTDVTVGPMNINEVKEELRKTICHGPLEAAVVLMERTENKKKYQTRIYVTRDDFKKYY